MRDLKDRCRLALVQAEPVMFDKETIIYADLDMQLAVSCRMEHDAIGHYSRPDVLELLVHE